MVVTYEENEDEIFQVDMDTEENTFRSKPAQETTEEVFYQQGISHSFDSNTASNIVRSNFLEVDSDTTWD